MRLQDAVDVCCRDFVPVCRVPGSHPRQSPLIYRPRELMIFVLLAAKAVYAFCVVHESRARLSLFGPQLALRLANHTSRKMDGPVRQ